MRLSPNRVAELDKREAITAGKLARVKGFLGRSSWRDAGDDVAHLTLYEYDSPEAAAEGLKVVVEGPILVESSRLLLSPPDVEQVVVVKASGKHVRETSVGNVMSISARIADPGLGESLDQDLENIFGELAAIDGFLGSVRGYRTLVEEERIGIALWRDLPAFQRSLPEKTMYELKAYKRIL